MIDPLWVIVTVHVRVMRLARMSLEGLATDGGGSVLCWSCLLSLEHLDLGAGRCIYFHGDDICQNL